MWCGGLALLLVLLVLLVRGQMDLLCAVLATGGLLLLSLIDKPRAILYTLVYLIFLGEIRRIVTVSFGPSKLDLLLLVAPLLSFYFSLPLLLDLRLRDLLSKAFFVLLVTMVLEIFNPQQGGLVVGVSGALFYIVPVLWFWIGRHYASPSILEWLLYRILLPLSVIAALLGLSQTFIGFLPYDQIWIKSYARIVSLNVGGTTRAFGFSVSATEYAELLSIGSAITLAAAFAKRRAWLLVLPLLVTVLFLASSRGIVVKLLLSASLAWILRNPRNIGFSGFLKLGLVLAAGFLSLYLGARQISSGETESKKGPQGVQALVSHQTNGFAHPLDSKKSTAAHHGSIVFGGVREGITDPVGHGLGSTTLAGGKFQSEATPEGSEVDFSDMFISLGLLGGSAFLCVLYAAVKRGLTFLREVPLHVALPVLAILSVTINSWLRAGEYSTNALACFLLGSLVYSENAHSSNPALVARTR